MIELRKSTAAAIVGLGAIAFAATPVLANGTDVGAGPMQLAHMDGARGNARTGSMNMMGSGMMGDHMGVRMMDPDNETGSCPGIDADVDAGVDKALDTGDVRASLERNLAHHGNKRLKVGTVEETDDDTIVAEIVTVDGSLVQRLAVDRATGRMRHID